MRRSLLMLCLCGLIAASSLAAGAASYTVSARFPATGVSTVQWTTYLTVDKFNPALGTLNSITYVLAGHVEGVARAESLDAAPSTINLGLMADITLQRPDMSVIAQVFPLATTTFNATAFDGILDWAGTSGIKLGVAPDEPGYPAGILDGNISEARVSPPPTSDLALFTGPGTVSLPVTALGHSGAYGPGNIVSWFSTYASAALEVTYDYEPTRLPEMGSLALASLGGLVGLPLWRRRRG